MVEKATERCTANLEEITAEFGGRDQAPLQRRPSPKAEPPPPSDDFFNTLSWGHGHPETAPVSQPEVDLFRYQEAPPRPEPPARPQKPSVRGIPPCLIGDWLSGKTDS